MLKNGKNGKIDEDEENDQESTEERKKLKQAAHQQRQIDKQKRDAAIQKNRHTEDVLEDIRTGKIRLPDPTRSDAKDRTETKKFSRKLLEWFIKLPRIDADRDATDTRLDLLYYAIGALRLPFHWAVCEINDRKADEHRVVRINGNATSLIANWVPQLFEGANIYLTTHVCENEVEARNILAFYDSPISIHKPADATRPEAVSNGVALRAALIPSIVRSADLAITGRVGRVGTNDVTGLRDLTFRMTPFLYWLEDLFKTVTVQARQRRITGRPVTAAVYMTWVIDPSAAREFWIGVMDDDLPVTDPRGRLARFIVLHKTPHTEALQHYLPWTQTCILAWNAWREGRKVDKEFALFNGKPLTTPNGLNKKDRHGLLLLDKVMNDYVLVKKK